MAKRLRLNSATEIRRALARIANMTLNGQIDAKTANSITATCNVILGAIRTDEDERRIDELEEIIEEMQN